MVRGGCDHGRRRHHEHPIRAGARRPDPGLSAIIGERRQLVNLAYRLLGSLTEAEDAVQETCARWYAMTWQQRDAIESPGAWLTTVASRVCLDLLGSARARRERYVGEWLPEPLPGPAEWPGGYERPTRIRLTTSPSMSRSAWPFIVVLEAMTPAERVAFILHDVFCHSSLTWPDHSAAPRSLPQAGLRGPPPRSAPRGLQRPRQLAGRPRQALKRAWEAADIDALVALLDPNATATPTAAARPIPRGRPVKGAGQIARYTVGIVGKGST